MMTPAKNLKNICIILISYIIISCNTSLISVEKSPNPKLKSYTKPGLFAFDGTWNKFETKSVIVDFYNEVESAEKLYYEGSSTLGTEVYPTIERALNDLCTKITSGKIDSAFAIGLSRGAIAAVSFASRANEYCHRAIPFLWVGLVDPVNTTIYDLPTVMPYSGKIPCVLIHKEKKWENVLTTKMIQNCNSAVIAMPKTHHDLSFYSEVTLALMAAADFLSEGVIKFKNRQHTSDVPIESKYYPVRQN